MYSVDDIFARLQKGDDPNAIAQEMADALNGALDQKRQADEAAARANDIQKQKVADANDLAEMINDFLGKYYDLGDNETLSGEDLISACDEAQRAIGKLQHLAEIFGIDAAEAPSKDSKSKMKKDADAAIGDFLRAFGL